MSEQLAERRQHLGYARGMAGKAVATVVEHDARRPGFVPPFAQEICNRKPPVSRLIQKHFGALSMPGQGVEKRPHLTVYKAMRTLNPSMRFQWFISTENRSGALFARPD